MHRDGSTTIAASFPSEEIFPNHISDFQTFESDSHGPPEGAVIMDRMSYLKEVREDDHVLGNANSACTLINYGNYLCPQSARAHRAVEAMLERHGQRVRFVFRHVAAPDDASHLAAEAAELAAARGKFWEMHKRLMHAQHLIEPAFLTWHAAALGLDTRAFSRELAQRIHAPRASRHSAAARHYGIHQTPSFFLNGRPLSIKFDARSLQHAVEREISHMPIAI